MQRKIDASIFQKIGMDNPIDQERVNVVLQTCTALVHPDVSKSLVAFGRCLKRKMEEMDTLLEDNHRLLEVSRGDDEEFDALKNTHDVITAENTALKQQIQEMKDRMRRYHEEAKDLREIQKKATKSTAEIQNQLTALHAEKTVMKEEHEHALVTAKRQSNALKKQVKLLETDNQFLTKSNESKTAELKKAQKDFKNLNTEFHQSLDEKEATMIELIANSTHAKAALRDAVLELERTKTQAAADMDDARSELQRKDEHIAFITEHHQQREQMIRVGIHSEYQPMYEHLTGIVNRFQSAFSFRDKMVGMPSICPVPTKSGYIDSFRNIVQYWMSNPTESEGELHATFPCRITGYATALASIEQIYLIHSIAADMSLPLQPPFVLQCQGDSEDCWEELAFHEQLAMAATICKIYRRKSVNAEVDHHIVMSGRYVLSFSFTQAPDTSHVMNFHLTPLGDRPPPATRMILTEPMLFDGMRFANAEPYQASSSVMGAALNSA